MYFAILLCAWLTRFTRGSRTCRWLTLIVCTCCDSGRVDLFSSAEFFHSMYQHVHEKITVSKLIRICFGFALLR